MKSETEKLKYIWHYDVHNKKFGETLLYLKLSFYPIYMRENIFDKIKSFFEKRGIYSYCIYELYGIYDLMLRIWIPPNQHVNQFRGELFKELETLYCRNVIPFIVEKNDLHWAWLDEENKKLISPSEMDVSNLSGDDITEVNQDDQLKINGLLTQNIIKEYKPKRGIKFFIVIPPPDSIEIPTQRSSEIILSRLKGMLIESKKYIFEPSIYSGHGFAWILIKGKVSFENYFMINELTQKINEAGVKLFYIHTYTYLVTSSDFQYCIEEEGFPGEQEVIELLDFDVVFYLKKEEDEQFEVKGSLWFDVDRWLRDKRGDFRDKMVAKEGVLRSIVGFLNANGGRILIGALEKRRYGDVLRNPNHPLHRYPMVGDRIVFGINNEYYAKGWDGFSAKLTDFISSHIGRDVSAMIKIKKYEYEGFDLCLVTVPRGIRWYYLDEEEFWVRRANSTILLKGPDTDNYKELYPRK